MAANMRVRTRLRGVVGSISLAGLAKIRNRRREPMARETVMSKTSSYKSKRARMAAMCIALIHDLAGVTSACDGRNWSEMFRCLSNQ
jgi:hypothetical protein